MLEHFGSPFRILFVTLILFTVASISFQAYQQMRPNITGSTTKPSKSASPSSSDAMKSLLRQNLALKKERDQLLKQRQKLKVHTDSQAARIEELQKQKEEEAAIRSELSAAGGDDFDDETPLDCLPHMLERLEQVHDSFDPFYHDFLRLFMETRLTVGNQRRFFLTPILENKGFYIKTAEDLKARLDRDARCWSRDYLQLNPDTDIPNIAVCLEQHSNGPDIQEYISHYLLLGVSKVIIYDNSHPESLESRYFRKVVSPFVELGYVIVNDFYFPDKEDFKPIQAFQTCFATYRNDFDWIGHLDSDEYFVVGNDYSGPPCLTHILPQYSEFGGLTTNWRFIASALGHAPEKDVPFIKKYRLAARNEHVKTFYQPKHVFGLGNQHFVGYVAGQTAVSSTRQPVDGPWNSRPDAHELFSLYHFYLRDWEYGLFEKICSPNHKGLQSDRTDYIVPLFLTHDYFTEKLEPNVHEELLQRFLTIPGIDNDRKK